MAPLEGASRPPKRCSGAVHGPPTSGGPAWLQRCQWHRDLPRWRISAARERGSGGGGRHTAIAFPAPERAIARRHSRTQSSHTRWGNELLPLSLTIDFRTAPYAHIPVTVCLRRQGAAGQPAPPPFASCTCARRGRCSSRPARFGYYLDRRCPQQSLSSSWKTPL